ncbi:MAG TPA: hypothetical protein VNT75_20150 [Symbiobacteriaceae bacterium]|nr:hypothetical protein [Symbiobacteriaceae bacterium]
MSHQEKDDNRDEPRDGAKFKPVDVSNATRKEEMNRIRGMQDIQLHGRGATDHGSNPNG